MKHTFAKAKRVLAKYTDAAGLADIGEAINTAIDELANTSNWQRMKRVVKLTANDEYIALPQDCEAIVRAAIDGVPVSLKGTDYDFLHGGPGDLDYLPQGYVSIDTYGIQDLGFFPTMYALTDTMPVVAFATGTLPTGTLQVRGKNADGDIISATVPINTWTELGVIPDGATATTVSFADIDSVTLPSDATEYISLYGVLDGTYYFLSRMNPKVDVPEFRRYRIPGFASEDDTAYHVLAEVRLRFLPLVNDRDVLPFDSLLPVQYMLQSMASMNACEKKDAIEYRQLAVQAMVTRENAQQEKQGFVVLNTMYEGSLGQSSSLDWDNI